MERIGRYQITGELGRGGMGIVYRAQDPAIGRTVAIKTIRLDSISDPAELRQLRDRLLREARSAGLLSHPSIVTIYDIGQEGNMAYIAMEFVQGVTLEQLVRDKGPLPGDELIRVLQATAEALDHAHGQGIIHRDVKPANIMISDAGAVKITDFGVAKIASQNMTQADMILGTPSFMSPEQIEGRPIDGRSDQFALGVIAYELLTGERPFVGDTLPGLLYQIVKQEPVSPHLLNSTLRDSVSRVIAQALDKHPDQRFLKCTAFVRALEAALNESRGWRAIPKGAAASQDTVAAPAVSQASVTLPPPRRSSRDLEDDPPARSNRWPFIAAAAGVLAAAGAGYVYYLNRPYVPAPQPEAVAEQTAPPPAAKADRPSPMPPPPGQTQTSTPPTPAPTTPTPAPTEPRPGGQSAAPRPSDAPQAGSTIVDIITNPGGATASIDNGASTCVTPCPQSLPNGRHVLTFTLAGYRGTTRIINLPQESTINMTLQRAEGTLAIRTTPAGASIYIDGQARAEKTNAMISLPAGMHKITLKRDGVPDYEESIEVKDQVITTVSVNW
ncbi:MAG: serine/threonine protein kinase [Bryobacterales bacterium]|nr:serine/threonine protein kinase [Bryobacterales bacterium]